MYNVHLKDIQSSIPKHHFQKTNMLITEVFFKLYSFYPHFCWKMEGKVTLVQLEVFCILYVLMVVVVQRMGRCGVVNFQ